MIRLMLFQGLRKKREHQALLWQLLSDTSLIYRAESSKDFRLVFVEGGCDLRPLCLSDELWRFFLSLMLGRNATL